MHACRFGDSTTTDITITGGNVHQSGAFTSIHITLHWVRHPVLPHPVTGSRRRDHPGK
jgi:hypothetical protein